MAPPSFAGGTSPQGAPDHSGPASDAAPRLGGTSCVTPAWCTSTRALVARGCPRPDRRARPRGAADSFEDRLALLFAVVGLGTLGVWGALLADEVRMVRQGAREAAVRPAYVEVTAGLLNGLTPARLLLLVSAFVLFLSAYASRG